MRFLLSKRISGSVLAASAVLAGVGFAAYRQAQPERANSQAANAVPGRVKVIRPAKERLQRTTTQPAQIEPYERADILARVPGYLKTVAVDIGDHVNRGDLMAEMWLPDLEEEKLQKQALVEQAEADLAQAEAFVKVSEALASAARAKAKEALAERIRYDADVAFRRSEHDRYRRLRMEGSVQQDQLDEKVNQLRAAEAAFAAATAAVDTANANVLADEARLAKARTDIRVAEAHLRYTETQLAGTTVMLAFGKLAAPFDGIVTRRFIHPGAFLQSAATSTSKPEPLLTLARVDRLRIVTDIPESESTLIKQGQPGLLRVDALRGHEFGAKVVRFADALDPATRTMRSELELDAPNSGTPGLRPGMFGSVSITLADVPDAVLLPTSTLLSVGGKPAVAIVEGGIARRRPIVLGWSDGVRMQIVKGLTGDEQVITDGKNTVQEGQAIEVVK
jgi:RND family efflux transporter MFP subunit